jgi:hypothetical protein
MITLLTGCSPDTPQQSTPKIQKSLPRIMLVAPTAGQYFTPNDHFVVAANVEPAEGVRVVEFFSNGVSLGRASQHPFRLDVTLAVGSYLMAARAELQSGDVVHTAPVRIVVREQDAEDEMEEELTDTGAFLFGVDIAVALLRPVANSTVRASKPVNLVAEAASRDGRIQRVEFICDERTVATRQKRPYEWVWTKAPAGRHRIRVRAIDDHGRMAESNTIDVNVKP